MIKGLPVNCLLVSDDGVEVASPSTRLYVFKYMNKMAQKITLFILSKEFSPRPRRRHYNQQLKAAGFEYLRPLLLLYKYKPYTYHYHRILSRPSINDRNLNIMLVINSIFCFFIQAI